MSTVHNVSTAYQQVEDGTAYGNVTAQAFSQADPLTRTPLDTIEVNVYWHTPNHGDPILIVDVLTNESSPNLDLDGNPTNVRVNVNDGAVYGEELRP